MLLTLLFYFLEYEKAMAYCTTFKPQTRCDAAIIKTRRWLGTCMPSFLQTFLYVLLLKCRQSAVRNFVLRPKDDPLVTSSGPGPKATYALEQHLLRMYTTANLEVGDPLGGQG